MRDDKGLDAAGAKAAKPPNQISKDDDDTFRSLLKRVDGVLSSEGAPAANGKPQATADTSSLKSVTTRPPVRAASTNDASTSKSLAAMSRELQKFDAAGALANPPQGSGMQAAGNWYDNNWTVIGVSMGASIAICLPLLLLWSPNPAAEIDEVTASQTRPAQAVTQTRGLQVSLTRPPTAEMAPAATAATDSDAAAASPTASSSATTSTATGDTAVRGKDPGSPLPAAKEIFSRPPPGPAESPLGRLSPETPPRPRAAGRLPSFVAPAAGGAPAAQPGAANAEPPVGLAPAPPPPPVSADAAQFPRLLQKPRLVQKPAKKNTGAAAMALLQQPLQSRPAEAATQNPYPMEGGGRADGGGRTDGGVRTDGGGRADGANSANSGEAPSVKGYTSGAGPTGSSPQALITRGRAALATGDVPSARKFLRKAAEAGSARGALLLAETFDPNQRDRLPVKTEFDPDRSRKWYLRALTLGGAKSLGPVGETLAARIQLLPRQ